MKKLFVLLAFLSLAIVANTAPEKCGPSPTCRDIAGDFCAQVISPYVEINSDAGTGSGVVVKYKGEIHVLTARHVVDDYKEARLYKRTDCDNMEQAWVADVVKVSTKSDLALLKPRVPDGLVPAKVDYNVKLSRGEDCWYVGTHSGLHAMLEKSIINRPVYEIDDEFERHKYTLVNGNGWYGNSGGPLYVKRGADYYVVGIVVRLAELNYRTPICAERLEDIREFLE